MAVVAPPRPSGGFKSPLAKLDLSTAVIGSEAWKRALGDDSAPTMAPARPIRSRRPAELGMPVIRGVEVTPATGTARGPSIKRVSPAEVARRAASAAAAVPRSPPPPPPPDPNARFHDPRAERLYEEALRALEAGDAPAADRHLSVALTYCPQDSRYLTARDKVRRVLDN